VKNSAVVFKPYHNVLIIMSHEKTRFFRNIFHDDGAVDIPTDLVKSRTQSCMNQILKNFNACEKNCDGG